MKVSHIHFVTRDRASIYLTPSWFRRLLGARTCVVEVEYSTRVERWMGFYTRDHITSMPHHELIEQALAMQPTPNLYPSARLLGESAYGE